MRNEVEEAVRIVAAGIDSTEMQRSDTQLVRLATATCVGSAAMCEAAHELRNSLAVISNTAELLFADLEDRELRSECERRMFTAIERACSILRDSLESVPFGHFQMAKIDIVAPLRRSLDLFVDRIAAREIKLERDFPPALPEVCGSSLALRQVFASLVANALEAVPQCGKLTVTGFAGPQCVEIRIHPSSEYSGLELAVSKYIIEQHNGTIEVENEADEESTVIIRLPRGEWVAEG